MSTKQLPLFGHGILIHVPLFKQLMNKHALSPIFSHLSPVKYKFGHLQMKPFSELTLFSHLPPFKQISAKISQTPSFSGH